MVPRKPSKFRIDRDNTRRLLSMDPPPLIGNNAMIYYMKVIFRCK
jgi:hypothetical protein